MSDEKDIIRESFVKKHRDSIRDVREGKITVEEYGLLTCLEIITNPYDIFWLGNFSILAQEFNLKPAKVRYICDKLMENHKIYFNMGQGKKKAKFYVLGYVGAWRNEVTAEFIINLEMGRDPSAHILDDRFSEVKIMFPKWLIKLTHFYADNYDYFESMDSDVS